MNVLAIYRRLGKEAKKAGTEPPGKARFLIAGYSGAHAQTSKPSREERAAIRKARLAQVKARSNKE